MSSLDSKTCACCGHLIYTTKKYGKRCGPGCDRAIPKESKGKEKLSTTNDEEYSTFNNRFSWMNGYPD